jgi:hypothetical protein
VTRAVEAWNRFFFEPTPTSTLALVRIAFGLVTLAWAAALGPDLLTFLGQDGLVARQPPLLGWGLLSAFPSDAAVIAVYAALVASAVLVTVGLATRLACAVAFVTLLSILRRDPFILNAGDFVLLHVALFLTLAPAGSTLSLDRWLTQRDRFWEVPLRAPWALRMLQIQLSVIYLASVWAKVRGVTWNDGTAVAYALRLEQIHRLPVPEFLVTQPVVVNVLTYGTLAVELAIAILVWNRRARPWVLCAGVVLHLLIDYALVVGFFSLAMFVLYLAFVSPEWATARVRSLQARFVPSPKAGRPATRPRLDSQATEADD